jgi:tetratricopeptide (TPR) repeat protein
MKPSDAFPRARAAAERALELDEYLGDAYDSLGMCSLFYDWDWDASESAGRRCLELNPDSLGARVWYPMLLTSIGRPDEAVAEARRAMETDPLSVNALTLLGQVLYVACRFDSATSALDQAFEIDPDYPTAVDFRGLVHVARGEFAEGITAMEHAESVAPHHIFIAWVGYAYGLAGRRDDAVRILDQLKSLASNSYVSPYSFSMVYQGIGDRERWRELVKASLHERSGLLVNLDCAPWNDCIRGDPFCAELRRQIGLLEPADGRLGRGRG